jgi:hypothetical protein
LKNLHKKKNHSESQSAKLLPSTNLRYLLFKIIKSFSQEATEGNHRRDFQAHRDPSLNQKSKIIIQHSPIKSEETAQRTKHKAQSTAGATTLLWWVANEQANEPDICRSFILIPFSHTTRVSCLRPHVSRPSPWPPSGGNQGRPRRDRPYRDRLYRTKIHIAIRRYFSDIHIVIAQMEIRKLPLSEKSSTLGVRVLSSCGFTSPG